MARKTKISNNLLAIRLWACSRSRKITKSVYNFHLNWHEKEEIGIEVVTGVSAPKLIAVSKKYPNFTAMLAKWPQIVGGAEDPTIASTIQLTKTQVNGPQSIQSAGSVTIYDIRGNEESQLGSEVLHYHQVDLEEKWKIICRQGNSSPVVLQKDVFVAEVPRPGYKILLKYFVTKNWQAISKDEGNWLKERGMLGYWQAETARKLMPTKQCPDERVLWQTRSMTKEKGGEEQLMRRALLGPSHQSVNETRSKADEERELDKCSTTALANIACEGRELDDEERPKLTMAGEGQRNKEESQEKQKILMVELCSSSESGADHKEDKPETIRTKGNVVCCYAQYWPGSAMEAGRDGSGRCKGKGKSEVEAAAGLKVPDDSLTRLTYFSNCLAELSVVIAKEEVDTVMIDPSNCSIEKHRILLYKEEEDELREENRRVKIIVKTNEPARTEKYDKAIARRTMLRAAKDHDDSESIELPPETVARLCHPDSHKMKALLTAFLRQDKVKDGAHIRFAFREP